MIIDIVRLSLSQSFKTSAKLLPECGCACDGDYGRHDADERVHLADVVLPDEAAEEGATHAVLAHFHEHEELKGFTVQVIMKDQIFKCLNFFT